MEFTYIKEARLIKRYKRFLADVLIDEKRETIYCPNTGAMTGCAEEGSVIWYSESDNKKRKYSKTWELTKTKDDHFIVIHSAQANTYIEEVLRSGDLDYLLGAVKDIRKEVPYGKEKSRADFIIKTNDADCIIEVKSATLLENGQGFFPDSVSTRGQKHLRELIDVVENGGRACLIFAILHSGIDTVLPAGHIDPAYQALYYQAIDAGVVIIEVKFDISSNGVFFNSASQLS